MNLTPILWFEIAAAAVLAVGLLWTNIEYGLFLYGLALGFPDVACAFGFTVNVRVDDVLILLFLGRMMLWTAAPPSRTQKTIFLWQGIFFAACVLSMVVEAAQGSPSGDYELAKLAGCAMVFLALPRLLQSERRLKFLVVGLVCGGIALAIQIHQHLGENATNSYANFQQLKSAAAFSTWNPNTVGQAAILFAFAAGLGAILFCKSPAGRIFWPSLALGFALLPLAVFVRGSSLSIAAAFLFFFCITRRWKSVLVFTLACTCALVALHYRDRGLMEDASSVNVATGEGFSHRFDRWGMAIEGIRKGPWLGHGFGQEMPYLTLIGSEGRAHDAYLAVWLELGAGGLLLFLAAIWQFFRAGWSLFESQRSRAFGGLILALILALCLDSVGLPTLYLEKLPTIALSIAVAVVGICERPGSTAFEEEAVDDALAYAPSTQNL